MDELFQQIEARIRVLVQKQRLLIKINKQLKETKQDLINENEQLLLKQKNIASLIENMISHLKSLEGLS